jgi:hypothetical protein
MRGGRWKKKKKKKRKKKKAELRGGRWSWYHEYFSLQNESLTYLMRIWKLVFRPNERTKLDGLRTGRYSEKAVTRVGRKVHNGRIPVTAVQDDRIEEMGWPFSKYPPDISTLYIIRLCHIITFNECCCYSSYRFYVSHMA